MAIASFNPATEEKIQDFEELSDSELEKKLMLASQAYTSWKNSAISERDALLNKLADILIERKEELAKAATLEIGQPIKSVYSEIEKSALLARYYEGNIEKFLKDETIETEASASFVKYEPLGTILGIAPWNFPYWMAFRFIIPTISAGNTVILKHASNVPQSALLIEEVMKQAGFPEGVFQTLLVSSGRIEGIIRDKRIQGVSFSGSENAGSKVSAIAGSEIKKSLLELGGSDAFIILEDADLENTVNTLVDNRLRNAGQACNSPKRVLVSEKIFEKFLELAKLRLGKVQMGDPFDSLTDIGPLATQQGLSDVIRQVEESILKGAKVELGGKKSEGKGFFYEPTIVTNVKPGMPLFDEEVFGPVIAVSKFSTIEEAIAMSNNTKYGLGVSIWTKDISCVQKYISSFEVANVFFNQPVRSDPRLPYGGIKRSGFGRELSFFGIREFTNIKTVVIK